MLQDSVELAEVDDQSDGIVFLGDSKTWGGSFILLNLIYCELSQSPNLALVVDFVFEHVAVFQWDRVWFGPNWGGFFHDFDRHGASLPISTFAKE